MLTYSNWHQTGTYNTPDNLWHYQGLIECFASKYAWNTEKTHLDGCSHFASHFFILTAYTKCFSSASFIKLSQFCSDALNHHHHLSYYWILHYMVALPLQVHRLDKIFQYIPRNVSVRYTFRPDNWCLDLKRCICSCLAVCIFTSNLCYRGLFTCFHFSPLPKFCKTMRDCIIRCWIVSVFVLFQDGRRVCRSASSTLDIINKCFWVISTINNPCDMGLKWLGLRLAPKMKKCEHTML